MAKSAHCDGKVSALRWQSQRAGLLWAVRSQKEGNKMVRWTQKAADWQRAYCLTERGQDKRQQKSLKDYPKILCNARATLYESEKKMPYVQDSFSLLDGCTAYIHRPTLGWTVREYILLCKVSLLHSPSSLGLDGHEQLLSRLEDAQEVPKEPSSPCLLIGFPCTAS